MAWFPFTIIALAVWRISNMLVNEGGPSHIFDKLRHAAGILHNQNSEPYAVNPDSFFATVLLCIMCTSMWVGLFFFAIAFFSVNVAFLLALPFAFSAVTCLIGGR